MSIAAQLAPVVRAHAASRFVVAVKAMETLLDAKCPVDTGMLMSSQTVTVSIGGTALMALMFYPLDYGEYHDRGMPAAIYPKKGRFLVFEGDGGLVFARVVHPTQKHKGWFTKTVLTWPAVLQAAF